MKLLVTITIISLIACSSVLPEGKNTQIAVQPMGRYDAALLWGQ